jgi:hypothetical protein
VYEALLLPAVLTVARRSNHGKTLLMALLHQLLDVGNMTDSNFFHLVVLVREFLYMVRRHTHAAGLCRTSMLCVPVRHWSRQC